ncbi:hypothetical protein FN976_23890 [Caenimonas sedimenti]|uniref:Uncharacterized protein n=2 Tax=Caenimonas sedimenti TaxID=2596921 RepID=A0A562ZIE5_9BURK|nr:hypothetical protein FN976_23890 [Caenimonas sedimenti]
MDPGKGRDFAGGLVLALGYLLLGIVPTALFATGYVGGFLLWVCTRGREFGFVAVRGPYWLTMALFVAHKVEESQTDFFPALSQLTGHPVPQEITPAGALLYALAGAWLLVPVLMPRRMPFGSFLAWSFFCAMGITELAHFVFPLFMAGPYAYFPGMATVALLAPSAWWGLFRMVRPVPGSSSGETGKAT